MSACAGNADKDPTGVKVLHLLWDGKLGGVQRYVCKVVGSECWPKGVSHGVCFFGESGDIASAKVFAGVPTWQLGLTSGLQWRKAKALRSVVEEFDADVIHVHCDTPAFSFQAASFPGRGLVFTEHGDTLVRARNMAVLWIMWRMTGSRWSAVLCNSKFAMGVLTRRYPWMASRCRVVHNPLLEMPTDKHSFSGEGPVRIGFMGRLDHVKGVDILLRSVALMRDMCRRSFAVEIFGSGQEEGNLKGLAEERGILDVVAFRGFTQHPLDEMRRMDIVAVPSRMEAFGLSALEAHSVGVPVVCFDGSGVAEVVVDGRSGIVVRHGDEEAYAAALASLVDDQALCESMGGFARQHALDGFSMERHVEVLMQEYMKAKELSDEN